MTWGELKKKLAALKVEDHAVIRIDNLPLQSVQYRRTKVKDLSLLSLFSTEER